MRWANVPINFRGLWRFVAVRNVGKVDNFAVANVPINCRGLPRFAAVRNVGTWLTVANRVQPDTFGYGCTGIVGQVGPARITSSKFSDVGDLVRAYGQTFATLCDYGQTFATLYELWPERRFNGPIGTPVHWHVGRKCLAIVAQGRKSTICLHHRCRRLARSNDLWLRIGYVSGLWVAINLSNVSPTCSHSSVSHHRCRR
jgi:hypothetical protein